VGRMARAAGNHAAGDFGRQFRRRLALFRLRFVGVRRRIFTIRGSQAQLAACVFQTLTVRALPEPVHQVDGRGRIEPLHVRGVRVAVPAKRGNIGRLQGGAKSLVLAMVLELVHRRTAAVTVVAQQALLPVDVPGQILRLDHGRLFVPQFAFFGVTEGAGIVFRYNGLGRRGRAGRHGRQQQQQTGENRFHALVS